MPNRVTTTYNAPSGAPPQRSRYLTVLRPVAAVISLFVFGNMAILAAHLWLERSSPRPTVEVPVDNFAVVDDRLWRGAAPGAGDYAALAGQGVTTVIDLRAEEGIRVDGDQLTDLGITRVHLPVRDGQAPSSDQVARFLEAVAASRGRVYVHCGAGVGRTGTMAAAYAVAEGGTEASEAVRRNLAVGPPSLEQLAFAARLGPGSISRPPPAVVAVSRALDAPRRFWVHVRKSYA